MWQPFKYIKWTLIEKSQAFKSVFESREGQAVLAYLAKRFHVLGEPSPRKGEYDPYELGFKMGQRNAILYIMAECNVDLDKARQLHNTKIEVTND